ncbi:hypothetical protein Cassandra_0359 [Pseudomonas phage Cassandra]|nr:hypothetical protein Cassandra_0359 [Pseudomonas phage Cassandra]
MLRNLIRNFNCLIISIVHLSCIEQKRSTLLSTRKSK